MKITLNYMGQLRYIAGKDCESCQCPDQSSVQQALLQDAGKYKPAFGRILFDDAKSLRLTVMILVNEERVSEDNTPVLSEGDSITILTPIAGG